MNLLQITALLVSSVALIGAVFKVRKAGTFPLATLLRHWFSRAPASTAVFTAIIAGIASVAVVPLIGLLSGHVEVTLPEIPTFRWIFLAFAGLLVKGAFVLFEEVIFRGALVSQLKQRTGPLIAIVLSALLFATSHGRQSLPDTAVLLIDGIGFSIAFLATEALWVPAIWHLSKNLSVWLIFGNGTIDLVPGPFMFHFCNGTPEWLSGSTGHAGPADLAVAVIVVAAASSLLMRQRAQNNAGFLRRPQLVRRTEATRADEVRTNQGDLNAKL